MYHNEQKQNTDSFIAAACQAIMKDKTKQRLYPNGDEIDCEIQTAKECLLEADIFTIKPSSEIPEAYHGKIVAETKIPDHTNEEIQEMIESPLSKTQEIRHNGERAYKIEHCFNGSCKTLGIFTNIFKAVDF